MAPMPVDRLPSELAQTHELLVRGPVTLLLRHDWKDALPVEAMLDGAPLTAWGDAVEHDLAGRAAVHALATPHGQLVAKAYTRGGLLGGLLRHWYLDPERPLREAAVAEELMRRGCPTPPVVVARVTRGAAGLSRLEIATARVERARDLLDVVREVMQGEGGGAGAETDTTLEALAADTGRTLRRLHDAGLHHRDLQVKNLLVPSEVSSQDAPLIVLDLDRCRMGEPLGSAKRVVSLTRFARSLVKNGILPGLSAARHRSGLPHAVRAFFTAHGALPGLSRAQLLRSVRDRLRKSLRTHEVLWDEPTDRDSPE